MWLLQKKHIYFEDLQSTKDSKKLFAKFVRRWNEGKLSEKYYRGIHPSELEGGQRTQHKWNLKGIDPMEMSTARDSVEVHTYRKDWGQPQDAMGAGRPPPEERDPMDRSGRVVLRSVAESESDSRDLRKERKSWQHRVRSDLEEVAPRPDPGSFAARVEKRRAKAGPSRDLSPEVDERTLMGGSEEAYLQKRVHHIQQRRQAKAEDLSRRAHEYRQQERDKVADLRAMFDSTRKPG